MLIDQIVKYCDDKYRAHTQNGCDNCSYEIYCPKRCDICLHYIHTPTAAPAPRKYDCPYMAYYYACKYSYKYMSELVYAFTQLRDLQNKNHLKVMSIGCGPSTDLFALDFLREDGVYRFNTIEFRGIDLAQNVWFDIHNQIKKYAPGQYDVKFYYKDVTEFIDVIADVKWVPDLIVFQYVFSDMEKHCEKNRLNEFISKIAQFINNDMNYNTYIVINDINLSTQMGGGREHFDKLLAQIVHADFRRLHFNNSNKRNHYNYGDEYEDNSLIKDNPQFLCDYEPYTSCASAQLIIKKVE